MSDLSEGQIIVIGTDGVWEARNREGKMFGKPSDLEDAKRILAQLSGKTHQVYSGVSVVNAKNGRNRFDHAVTKVTFRRLSDSQIIRYFNLIDPLDKAGAYAIQGAGGIIIEKLEGCYYNVVGLPLTVLDRLLVHFGAQLL